MEWPTLGWLIGVLLAVAAPVVLIFIALAVIRWDRLRAQRAVRSPRYWEERPDGRRYPTGWDRRRPRGQGEEDQPPGEGPSPGEEPDEGYPPGG